MTFPESALAHKYLDGLSGIEIGGCAHNQFGLHTANVDWTHEINRPEKQQEINLCGTTLPVNILAFMDDLPFKDGRLDFVITSHIIEHVWDPIKTIEEWLRVIRTGGYIFMIVPHMDRTRDSNRPVTSLQEILDRHSGKNPVPVPDDHGHHSVWRTADFMEICTYMNLNVVQVQDPDDKVGNGFTVVVQKK